MALSEILQIILEYEMNKDITMPRRQKLLEALEANNAIVLFAARQGKLEKFKQENNFLYLTGLNIPHAIYLAIKREDRPMEYLFIESRSSERVVWEGEVMSKEEASELSGITNVLGLEEFESTLEMYCPSLGTLYANIGPVSLSLPLPYALFRLNPFRERFASLLIKDINGLLTPLRKIKSEWEIEQLQRAIDITGEGIMDIWRMAKAGMNEYELEAILFYRMQRSGLKHWGFAPIIASGINAATLHYEKNECEIKDGELVLLDVGASYLNYSADITRCFPVSGKFSPRQAAVYNSVLKVNKTIIELVKPGVKLGELQDESRKLLAAEMFDLGLIRHPRDVGRYYMHGIGHFLGMDTHDLGGREAVLEPGNVITVEPGIYIPEEDLGVRIEDDILVTTEGNKNLSSHIPKEIDDIEKYIRENR